MMVLLINFRWKLSGSQIVPSSSRRRDARRLCLDLCRRCGTLTGRAQGHDGLVTVDVTVAADGRIEAIKVGPNKETVGIADPALSLIPEKIVAEQTLAVDSLTGASFCRSRAGWG